MQIKNYFLAVFLIVFITTLNPGAQNPSIIWFETYGGEGWEGTYWVEEAGRLENRGESGYIMVGSTHSFIEGYDDIYLIKTDANGFVEWEQFYGDDYHDVGYCVKPTMDGGYIVCGATWDASTYESDGYLLKTDAYGDTIWTGKYGGSRSELLSEVCQLSDGGYIAAGHIFEAAGYHTNIYLVRTDANGQLLWSREHGRLGYIDRAHSIQPANDNGFILCGWMNWSDVDCDVQLTKVDAGGNIDWTRNFGGDRYDKGFSVARASDGGYIIAGYKTVPDRNYHYKFYLIKTSIEGFVEWERTFGGTGGEHALSVRQTVDGGYIMAGHSSSFGQGGNDIYVVKTDVAGNLEWQDVFGDYSDEIGECIRQVSDGNYVITGHAETFNGAYHDAFLMKIRPGQVGLEEEMSEFTPHKFIIQQNYPNPFNSTTTIRYRLPGTSDVTIAIYDLLGREIETLFRGYKLAGSYQVVWNADNLKSGNYFYKIETDWYSETKKMILLR
jgi:hypothetical protein